MMPEGNVILSRIIILVVAVLVAWILILINHRIFRRIQDRKKGLQLVFFERINVVIIVIACAIMAMAAFGGFSSVWKTMLGGTAIVSAVLAFAAQDVIKDILAGLMISVYKPFEIGNRIELEDGTAGIVKDITMRHVVIHTWDTQEMIIPNSKLNGMTILNNSFQTDTRSVQLFFHIAYGSDVEQAMTVIREAIIASPYTVPGKRSGERMVFAPVYFMAYEESSLQLATTVYYEETTATEVVRSDVNLRVNHALQEHGIEIPYNYVNVIMGEKK